MKKSLRAALFAATVLGVFGGVFAAAPSRAEAKGVMVINTGEDFFEAGPITEFRMSQDPAEVRLQAGYKCNVFGIFWAYMHWWGCEPVLYFKDADDTYHYRNDDDAKAIVNAHYKQSDMKLSFWAGNGRWIFLGSILLLVGGPLLLRGRGGDAPSDASSDDES